MAEYSPKKAENHIHENKKDYSIMIIHTKLVTIYDVVSPKNCVFSHISDIHTNLECFNNCLLLVTQATAMAICS